MNEIIVSYKLSECAGRHGSTKEVTMNKIEEMKNYIKRTNIPQKTVYQYPLYFSQMQALHSMEEIDALALAFNYGMAKGFRAGKAAKKRLDSGPEVRHD